MTTYKTEDFEPGSEFQVAWEISRPNPRYNPFAARAGKVSHREIISNIKSNVFDTYEAARECADNAGLDHPRVQVRRPGTKNFIPVWNAKKVGR